MNMKTKLSREQFEKLTTKEITDYGIFYQTKTDICKYGQAYSKKETLKDDNLMRYLNFYYPIYSRDYDDKLV